MKEIGCKRDAISSFRRFLSIWCKYLMHNMLMYILKYILKLACIISSYTALTSYIITNAISSEKKSELFTDSDHWDRFRL